MMLKWIISSLAVFLMLSTPSPGAALYLEDFNPDANGWVDRDAGEMTVSHDAGNDWMVGSFNPSILPMTDAFRINTGTDFLGDYTGPSLTQISFQFYAVNVLPSDLIIRLIDDSNIFTYQFNPLNLASWQTYTVDLIWSFGWIGSSESAFNTALTSVDALEIQVTRSGSGAQSYYLDNIQTLDTDIGDPGGPTAVPEPGTLNLIILVVMMVAIVRRYNAKGSYAAA